MGALAGLACGVVAAVPLALLMRREATDMARALAAVIFSFLFVQGAMVVVWLRRPNEVASFGVCAVMALLAVTVASVVRREMRG